VSFRFPGVSGASPRMREALNLMELVAPSDATVLLLGETGTGKELAAQAIHLNSPRRGGPFVVVNCAAIPENLLESELFGHERGAFTGATGKKDGRFLLAHRGTLFLDEIGEFSPALQAKILRVLQTREFEPLGSNRTLKADVRIIAATNRDLEVMVRDGRFREDLYYRLNVFPITLPPLRDRVEDLPQLAEFFLWPGNIRELENVIERGVIMCQTDTLTLKELPLALQSCAVAMPGEEAGEPTLMELERQLILRTLEKMSRNRQQAAEVLGISLDELNLKIRAYGLEI